MKTVEKINITRANNEVITVEVEKTSQLKKVVYYSHYKM